MKRCILIVFMIAAFQLDCLADGPPVSDDGTITSKHVVFQLDPQQIDQAGQRRVVSLNQEQIAELNKISNKLPHTFPVLSPFYHDCTCDLIYLIWNTRGTVVLPLNDVEYFESLLKEDRAFFEETLRTWYKDAIILDAEGDMFYRGHRIDLSKVAKLIETEAARETKHGHYIDIKRPPLSNDKVNNKVDTVIQSVQDAATTYKVKVQVGG